LLDPLKNDAANPKIAQNCFVILHDGHLKHKVLLQSLAKRKTNPSQRHRLAGDHGDFAHLFVEVYGWRIESTLRVSL
jgi:hypothetical protein